VDLTCPSAALQAALAPLGRLVPSRPAQPVLSGLLLTAAGGSLTVQAFDGTIAATWTVPAEVALEGSCVAPGAMLTALAHRLPTGATVRLRESSRGLSLEAGGGTYDLSTEFGPDDWPELPEAPADGARIGVEAGALREALGFVAFAAAKCDSGRPVAEAVALTVRGDGRAEVAATDGHRVAVAPVAGGDGSGQVLLPAPFVAELMRALPASGGAVEVEFADGAVQVMLDNGKLSGRLIDGTYPPYRKLIPSSWKYEYSMDRKELIEAIERVKIVADNVIGTVVLEFNAEEQSLSLQAENDYGGAREILMAESSIGGDFRVCFNAGYMLDALKRLEDDSVIFNGAGDQLPGRFMCPTLGADWIQLVVPRVVK
jgi:DNA polymerase-3 subunit beta